MATCKQTIKRVNCCFACHNCLVVLSLFLTSPHRPARLPLLEHATQWAKRLTNWLDQQQLRATLVFLVFAFEDDIVGLQLTHSPLHLQTDTHAGSIIYLSPSRLFARKWGRSPQSQKKNENIAENTCAVVARSHKLAEIVKEMQARERWGAGPILHFVHLSLICGTKRFSLWQFWFLWF